MSVVHALRLRPFRLLWAASTVSALGDGVHWIALPLLAATVTTDPRLISLVTVAEQLPWLLFGLLAGGLADRLDRRRVLWVVDLARGGIVAGFTVTVLTGVVTLPLVFAMAFLLTTAGTLYTSTAAAYVTAVVEPVRRPAANSRLQAGTMVADTLLGAPVGATLFVLAAVLPFVVDTLSFGVAALLVAIIPAGTTPTRPRPETTLRADVAAGVRFLAGHRLLSWLCAYGALLNLVTSIAVALLVLYTQQVLHLGNLGYGLLVAAFAVGGVGGSLAAGRVAGALGNRRALLLAVGIAAVAVTCLAAASTAVPAGVAVAAFGAGSGLWNVVSVSTRQQLVPDRMFGRVTSAYRLVTLGAGPLGALAAGFVAHRYGLRSPMWLGAGLLAVAAVAAPALLVRRQFPAADAAPPTDG